LYFLLFYWGNDLTVFFPLHATYPGAMESGILNQNAIRYALNYLHMSYFVHSSIDGKKPGKSSVL
jgi:hypothetical protein